MGTVKGVSHPAISGSTIGSSSRASITSGAAGMQMSPRARCSMKFSALAVTQLAAICRSPSFSRSSSSTTSTISPRRIRLSASSTVASSMGQSFLGVSAAAV
jgi:hypothetical protein